MCTVFKNKKNKKRYIQVYQTLAIPSLKTPPRTPPFISYLHFLLAVRAGLHRPVVGHVEAALPRPVRALLRAAERLPHPGGAWWEELGGSGRWVQRLVQLQAPGETSWRYWSSPAGASDLAAGHLFACDRPSDTHYLDGHCRGSPPGETPEQQSQFVPSLFAPVSQADVCHAYQIVHKNGIPDEHIVVMMYDDLATNEEWVQFHFPHTTVRHPLVTLFSSHLKSYLSASICRMSGDANLLAD